MVKTSRHPADAMARETSISKSPHASTTDPDEREVLGALTRRHVIIAGPADQQQFALPDDRHVRMVALHQFTPPRHAQRPEAFAKKSRSTSSWPIVACKRSTSAALAPASAGDAFRPNVVLIPSVAAFLQTATRVRIHAVTGANLSQCLFAFDRFQRNPGLEVGRVTLPCDLAHIPSFPQGGISLKTCPIFGNHLRRGWVRLHEKGGKEHEVPSHHSLERLLDDYIEAAGIAGDPNGPLFRSTGRKIGKVQALWQQDVYRMIQRRAAAAGITTKIGNHTFRATGITAYLKNKGLLEHAQTIANHASPRTTEHYDRRSDETLLDEVGKIAI